MICVVVPVWGCHLPPSLFPVQMCDIITIASVAVTSLSPPAADRERERDLCVCVRVASRYVCVFGFGLVFGMRARARREFTCRDGGEGEERGARSAKQRVYYTLAQVAAAANAAAADGEIDSFTARAGGHTRVCHRGERTEKIWCVWGMVDDEFVWYCNGGVARGGGGCLPKSALNYLPAQHIEDIDTEKCIVCSKTSCIELAESTTSPPHMFIAH